VTSFVLRVGDDFSGGRQDRFRFRLCRQMTAGHSEPSPYNPAAIGAVAAWVSRNLMGS